MQKEVIAVFDIGKSNKKILLFDSEYHIVFKEDKRFDEIKDEDDYSCDNIDVIEKYHLEAVNFATYGSSLMYFHESIQFRAPDTGTIGQRYTLLPECRTETGQIFTSVPGTYP